MAQSSAILPISHFTVELMLSWNTVPCFTVISFTCVMLFYKLEQMMNGTQRYAVILLCLHR